MSDFVETVTALWEADPEAGRQFLREAALAKGESLGEWAGYPVPAGNARLTLANGHPLKGEFEKLSLFGTNSAGEAFDDEDDGWRIVNQWRCLQRGGWVVICRNEKTGERDWFIDPTRGGAGRRLRFQLDTMGVAYDAWDTAAELEAMRKLSGLISARAFRAYVCAGAFIETSPRSRVQYVFRKLRPTLALGTDADGMSKVLAALCLHPVGYYEQTFAGSMTPTDDVIAHLMLMRADERGFWAKANHHEMHEAESGI